jgi:hypothetical protein
MGSLFWELLALGGAFCRWDFVCPQFPLVVWWFVSAVCFAGLFVSLVCLFRWFVSLAVWTGAQLLGDERPDE